MNIPSYWHQAYTIMIVGFFSNQLTTFVSRRYRYEFILDFIIRTALTVIIKDSHGMLMNYFWT